MKKQNDLKALAKIKSLCERYEKGGWLSWENELYLGDIEELIDKCHSNNLVVKRMKEMIKEYYEEIGRAVSEPVENNADSILIKKIISEAKKIKVPNNYIVMEKLKDE